METATPIKRAGTTSEEAVTRKYSTGCPELMRDMTNFESVQRDRWIIEIGAPSAASVIQATLFTS